MSDTEFFLGVMTGIVFSWGLIVSVRWVERKRAESMRREAEIREAFKAQQDLRILRGG